MNKNKKNRKGFTIVELVIVIAVIGILATVLVPTFGSVIADANKVKAEQQAKSLYTNYVSATAKTGEYEENCVVVVGDYTVTIEKGGVASCVKTSEFTSAACYNKLENGSMTPVKGSSCSDASCFNKANH